MTYQGICPECGTAAEVIGTIMYCPRCGNETEIEVDCPQDPQYVDGPEADYIYEPPHLRGE